MKLKHNVTGNVIEVMNGTLYAKSAWSKVGADKKPAADKVEGTDEKATPPKKPARHAKPAKPAKKKPAAKPVSKTDKASTKKADEQSQPSK